MKVIILVLGFLLGACSSQVHPDKRQIRYYQEIIGLYPPDLVLGFPNKIDKRADVITHFQFPRGKYLNYIHLGLSLDDNETQSLKTELVAKAKAVYHLTDSCLMTIPYDYNNFTVVFSDSLHNCNAAHILPIPHFKCWGIDFSPDFYKDATSYVLDAKQGRFLEDDNLSRSGVGLPKEWLHGYTKGVTIFKNYVIYWLEVW